MKTSVKRRELLKLGALGYAVTLAGCGRSHLEHIPLKVWDPTPWLLFRAGASNVSLDLSLTLPTGVRRGGTFSLASTSGSLPDGMSLSAQGILIAVNPVAGITSKIIFSYAEPAA